MLNLITPSEGAAAFSRSRLLGAAAAIQGTGVSGVAAMTPVGAASPADRKNDATGGKAWDPLI
jgi:hypothetical protein